MTPPQPHRPNDKLSKKKSKKRKRPVKKEIMKAIGLVEIPELVPEIQEEVVVKKEVSFDINAKQIDTTVFDLMSEGLKLRIKGTVLVLEDRWRIFRMLSYDNRWAVLDFILEVYKNSSTDYRQKIETLVALLRTTTYKNDRKWVIKSLEIF